MTRLTPHRFISITFLLSSFIVQEYSCDDTCDEARDAFANSSALFILCAVENARPIKLCENCIDAYFNVVDSYQNMSKITFNGTTSCHDVFVNQDRLEIVESLYRNTEELWLRAKCYDCYIYEDGKPTKHVSNNTLKFNEYHDKFRQCVNAISPEKLCSRCIHDYNVLNNYFTSISDVNEKISSCIDLVDIMNDTWTYWSDQCCKYRRHDEYVFIGISIGVISLTIIFYVVIQFCDEKKAPLIVPQTRFAESINSLRSEVGQMFQ